MIVERGVKHVALFWLKDPATASEALELMRELGALPQVISLAAGSPIDHDWNATRIDKSFDIAMDIWLKDIDACRDYFNEPEHQRIAGRLRDMSERLDAYYIEY